MFLLLSIQFQNKRGRTAMPLGLCLIIYLLALYIGAMVLLWQSLRGQKTATPLVTEVPFALREGQTIVGIGETTQGIDFYIGDYVSDEHYCDL
jgi:hypothetical protein